MSDDLLLGRLRASLQRLRCIRYLLKRSEETRPSAGTTLGCTNSGEERAELTFADFSFTIDHGEALIMNLHRNCIHGLNKSATFIFLEMRSGKSKALVEKIYADQYCLPLAKAREDVEEFCESLVARGLLR